MRSLFLFLAGLLLSINSSAESFKLRAHSSDKNKIGKPATVQYVDADSEDSYSIDAALTYLFLSSASETDWSLGIEAHKDTLIDKEQDTLEFYVSADRQWLSKKANTLSMAITPKYQRNGEKDSESFLLISEFWGSVDSLRLNGFGPGDSYWYWAPTFGIEYENVLEDDDDQEGDLFRIYGQMEVAGWIIKDELSFSLSHSVWRDVSKDDDLGIADDTHELSEASIKYSLGETKSGGEFSIAVDWLNGENPRTKKQDQRYTRLSFGVKF